MNNLSYRVDQVKTLKNGKGMQYLLNAGYKILGNPIFMHDIDYKLLSHTQDIITDDPLWNELITTGMYGDEKIEFFKNEYFIDAVANAETITYLASDKLKYDRILGKIFSGNNITVACAVAVACNKPFEDDDLAIFEAFCKKLSKEISKNEAYQIYGETHQESMICELIEGNIKDKKLYTRHVAEIYDGLKNFLYIAVADISKFAHGHTGTAHCKNIFKRTHPAFKYAVYAGNIVIIFSSDSMNIKIAKDLKRFEKLADENDIRIGVSQHFENLFELRKHYLEALNALNYGLKRADDQRIYLYDKIPADCFNKD